MRRLADIMPTRLSRFVAYFGLAAYLIGSIYNIGWGTPHIFQRFGALGVAAAVLFFTDRLQQIELNRQNAVERILHEFGLELEVMRGGVSPSDLPKDGFLTDYLDEEVQFQVLRKRAERINSGNIFLLTIATLQWGFGDVFLNRIFS